ncbi:MAG: hypothetical protein DM484_16500, partial [Candidatus Methylumidiphilus alinenensis]
PRRGAQPVAGALQNRGRHPARPRGRHPHRPPAPLGKCEHGRGDPETLRRVERDRNPVSQDQSQANLQCGIIVKSKTSGVLTLLVLQKLQFGVDFRQWNGDACVFHAIRPAIPRTSGHPIHDHSAKRLERSDARTRLCTAAPWPRAAPAATSQFLRSDEENWAWRAVDPVLKVWAVERDFIHTYPAGSWGPAEANRLFEKESQYWRNSLASD